MATTLEKTFHEGVTLLRLRGSLTGDGTMAIAPAFEDASHASGARVVVDLSGVDIITTPALSMFVAAASRARETGGRVIFAEAMPHVRALLERLRLTLILDTAGALEEALAEARA